MSKKILYFYDSRAKGFNLDEEKAKARDMRALARDVAAYTERDTLEICDAVAGEVPERYLKVEGIEKVGTKATKGPDEDKPIDYDQQPNAKILLEGNHLEEVELARRAAPIREEVPPAHPKTTKGK